MKVNCWEYNRCGRQPGGTEERELGVCPTATDVTHNGKNGGRGAGRYCWRVVGTLCDGEVQGTFAQKMTTCVNCDFLKRVMEEEGDRFVV